MPASFYLRDWRRYGFAYRVYILCFAGEVCNLRFIAVVLFLWFGLQGLFLLAGSRKSYNKIRKRSV